jgi:predicted phage terminase large subunit-like protein
MNRDVQRIIDAPEYTTLFPNTRLGGANVRTVAGNYLRNSDIFEIVGHRGSYRSAGIGGGITGRGFDYGIIDDPIKNRKEANSPTIRDAIWEWYTSTFYTRQEKRAAILITVTRWHLDDLAGRLLNGQYKEENGEVAGEDWTVVSFPALATVERHEADPREIDEPLWPGKYDKPTLIAIRSTIGAYDWNALYQQNPVPEEGGLFKRSKFEVIDFWQTDSAGRFVGFEQLIRFYDLALSEKTSADYTVGVLMGRTRDQRYVVLDVARFQKEWDDIDDEIVRIALADGPNVHIWIEANFFHSLAVRNLLKREELHGYVIRGLRTETDKFTRALPFAARVGEGMVSVLRRHWTESYLAELSAFPMGANDDMVDGSSGAYNAMDRSPKQATTRRYGATPAQTGRAIPTIDVYPNARPEPRKAKVKARLKT